MNIAQHVEHAAALRPAQPAILFEGRTISYAELERRAGQVASLLDSWNVVNGDRVALFLPNIPAFAMTYLGTQKVGAVAVSLNSMLKPPELEYALRDAGARVLFTTEDLLGMLAPVRAELPRLAHVVVCEGHAPDATITELGLALEGRSGDFPSRARSAHDPAAILYTSGTTGKPKGAVLTHGNLVSNTSTTAQCVGSDAGDRHLLFLPLSHCFGQNFIMNTSFRSSGTLVLERRYRLESLLTDIRRHEVSHFYGVPTIYVYLLAAAVPPEELASVRFFFSAAAMMPAEVARTWRERFGAPIYEGYGLTETAPLATYNRLPDYQPGSVGTPIDGVELRIIDEQGRPCSPGEWGEICIEGPNVMAGYFGREEETQAVLREGWFRSGDIGYRDEEDHYYLVDRIKDMINCAGFKVWPREVEEVLYRHPAVAECAVVGVPDPAKGERVVAFVQLKPRVPAGTESLHEHCEAQLARYKLPEKFVFDTPIPKSPSGKILKRLLREGRIS